MIQRGIRLGSAWDQVGISMGSAWAQVEISNDSAWDQVEIRLGSAIINFVNIGLMAKPYYLKLPQLCMARCPASSDKYKYLS